MIDAVKRATDLAPEEKEMLTNWFKNKAFWGVGAIAGAFTIADMLRPEGAEAIPVTAAVRASILQRMATTPKREALLAKAIPRLEEELKAPGIKRAFVGGSFASPKIATPSDLDIFVQGPEYAEFFKRRLLTGKTEELPLFPPLHAIPASGTHPEAKRFGEAAKDFLAAARKVYGPDYHWKRIFSAAGLAAGASALAPEEAEAIPIKEIIKSGRKAMLKTASSAERDLIGRRLGDKVVTGVKRAKGDWRRIYFHDGTEVDLTKDYLNSLMRGTGTKNYMREFMTQPARGRQSMAAAALSKRLDMLDIPISEHVKRYKEHITRLNQIERVFNLDPGGLVTESVWVRYPRADPNARILQMPKLYADELEKAGEVTILRGEPK
ncbi:MAG: hypothetical protein DDT18_00728 [Actinobacteria bacterium]|nr:hypothetical protein [Actinomycetota bacterium]